MIQLIYDKCCGRVRLWDIPDDILTGAYIVEGSIKDPIAPNYQPYVSENGQFYYVQENSTLMDERYHSEDGIVPLTGMSLFIGLRDNGDGSFTNVNFTPQQMVSYITSQTNFDVTAIDGDTQSDGRIGAFELATISDGTQTYNRSQFLQTGTSFQMTNGASFYAGQLLTLQLR